MGWLVAAVAAALLILSSSRPAGAVCASTNECASKLNGYAILNGQGLDASKLNGYAVLNGQGLNTSKINSYVVLCTPAGVGACPAGPVAKPSGLTLLGIGG